MGSFLSDTNFKSFSSKYVYVEAATTMAAPSHALSPVFRLYCTHVTAEIETGMAGKSSWDQANGRKKLGLVWIIRKKISQIIKDYFYLPFFLLIILWLGGWDVGCLFEIAGWCESGNRGSKYLQKYIFRYITVKL